MNLHENSSHYQEYSSLERSKRRKERALQLTQEREENERTLREEEEARRQRLKLEQKIKFDQKQREQELKELQASKKERLEKWEEEKAPYEIIIFRKFRSVIAEEGSVDVDEVLPDSSFANDLGFDEVDIIQLMMRLEEEIFTDLDIESDLGFVYNNDGVYIGCLNDLIDFLVENRLVIEAAGKLLDDDENLYNRSLIDYNNSILKPVFSLFPSLVSKEVAVSNRLIQDLGLDEIKIVEIVEKIEDEIGIILEDSAIEKMKTVEDIFYLLIWKKLS